MSKTILIDASNSEQTRIAVTVNDKLDDFEIESNKKNSVKGDVYLAKITRVEPSLQAAFVDFGANRNGFLPLNEIHPDYFKIPSTDKDEVKKLYDKLTDNNEDNEVEMIPSVPDENNDLYDDSVVLAFYSKSSEKPFPGEGASESITTLRKSDYMQLSKIKNWRKMLSNFYVKRNENNEIVPLFELDGYKWASVEHYYHANKFIKENPDFYKKFTMDEQTEISFDPSKAKGAGGKTGKIKGILFRPESVKIDSTFMDNKNNENIMYKAQYEKYRQNEELKNMLLLTNDSKLIHIVRGQDNIPFWNTMKIRQRLKSLN